MNKKVSIIEVTFGGYTRFYLTIDALYPEGIYKTVFEKVDQSLSIRLSPPNSEVLDVGLDTLKALYFFEHLITKKKFVYRKQCICFIVDSNKKFITDKELRSILYDGSSMSDVIIFNPTVGKINEWFPWDVRSVSRELVIDTSRILTGNLQDPYQQFMSQIYHKTQTDWVYELQGKRFG